jgi:RimJ/RimL family protein N-acetyltransferase
MHRGRRGDREPGRARTTLRGPQVRLRPAAPADASVLDLWESRRGFYHGEFNDLGIAGRSGAELATAPPVTDDGGFLIVELATDSRPIGTVSWHAVSYGPNPQSRAWNFGIALVPDARGHGFGVEAQQMLIDYLFATTDACRVEASTDVENIREQRALEKAGMRCEGIARAAQFRAGSWHDLVIYARIRSDA